MAALFVSQLLHYMCGSQKQLKWPNQHLASLYILTLEARLSFFIACIIPRRPWQPDTSLLDVPAAGELSWDATPELGMMLMLSGVEALSSMFGSAPFRQLKVFRRLWGGGSFNSVDGGRVQGSTVPKKKKGLWLSKGLQIILLTNTSKVFVYEEAKECDLSVITP